MGKSIYRYFSLSIPANSTQRLSVYGKFLTVLSNDQSQNPRISIAGDPEEQIISGISVDLATDERFFDYVIIRNPTGNTMLLEIAFSAGIIYDSRLQLSGSTFDDILNQLQGDTTADEGGDRIQLSAENAIISANTDRKEFGIHNPFGNGTLYLRFEATTVVTTTNYAIALASGQTFSNTLYRGEVRGLMATSGQYAHFWEL